MNGPKTATANWKTQYYLTLITNPSGVDSPSGAGWYDSGVLANISTDAFVDIVPGSSRYRFNGWTTDYMPEIGDPTRSPTTVSMDQSKTVTANYVVQYNVTFNQSGVGPSFTGTVAVIDGVNITVGGLPVPFWWDNGSSHSFAYQSPLVVTVNNKQYAWISTTGLSSSQSGTLIISASGSITGNYKTQYYLTVTSLYDSPNPTSGWIDSGTSVTASVTSPYPGPSGARYSCTGWAGSGSVPATGTSASTSFTMTQPSNITWNWKVQYLLTVLTAPSGLSPQPTRNPLGEAGPTNGWWYDDPPINVTLTAQNVTGYNFNNWDIDGTSQGFGTNPVAVIMDAPHTATAHYTLQAPTLSVTISPLSATIPLGNSVPFTSTVAGGTPPYSYQWYLNGNPASGATSNTWTFTPTAPNTYYVYLKVTDANNNTATSDTARVIVTKPPIGGYSVSMTGQDQKMPLAAYFGLVALFGAILSLRKRKRK
jgi:LPXTG-motif cell wall-anchored protein